MQLVVDASEVDDVLATIEGKLDSIRELTKDGFNAEQECLELKSLLVKERKSLQIPTIKGM